MTASPLSSPSDNGTIRSESAPSENTHFHIERLTEDLRHDAERLISDARCGISTRRDAARELLAHASLCAPQNIPDRKKIIRQACRAAWNAASDRVDDMLDAMDIAVLAAYSARAPIDGVLFAAFSAHDEFALLSWHDIFHFVADRYSYAMPPRSGANNG